MVIPDTGRDLKYVPSIPPLDHAQIEYEPFEKDFYKAHPEITAMAYDEVKKARKTLRMPVHFKSWNHCGQKSAYHGNPRAAIRRRRRQSLNISCLTGRLPRRSETQATR